MSSLEDQPGKLLKFLEAVAGNATRRAAEQAVRMKLPNVVMENNTLYKVYADGRREVLKAKVTSDYFVPQAARASRKNGSRKK